MGMTRATLAGLLFAAAVAVAACGGASPTPAEKPATRTAADLGPMCHRHYAREQACVDEYLSAELDLRVELNMPPGIADEVKTQGRDAVMTQVRADFERDIEPSRLDAICNAMATQTPADQVDRLLKQGDACEA